MAAGNNIKEDIFMKKRSFLVVSIVVLVLFAVQAFAAYDSATVKKAMRTHAALLGETSKAVEANDFFLAAEKLMENATLFKSLMVMSPKKGSEAEWNRILNGMLKAAFKGIGACGEENAEGVAAAISELKAVKKEGHKMFK